MAEYECAMEELENRSLLEKSGKYKPISLIFCENLGFDPLRIFHNVVEKS